jgi:hypothetical protein
MRILFPLLVLALVSGCSSPDETSAPGGDGDNNGAVNNGAGNNGADLMTYHRDIKPLLEAQCNECHREGGIAPFAFSNYDEVKAQAPAIAAAVANGSMPPWLPDDGCQEYFDERKLTTEQKDAIAKWVTEGSTEGDPEVAPYPWVFDDPSEFRADLTLTVPESYTPQQSPDDYRCFLIDWPKEEEVFVAGFRANPGNDAIVHHVIAFLIPPHLKAEYQALDDAEEGTGYTCYGGPGGEIQGAGDFVWLGGWAPGNPGIQSQGQTGIRVAPGSVIALQIHYNTINGTGPDQSSIDFRIEETVEREAWTIPFTNPQWLQGEMPIPAGRESVTHSFQFDITNYMEWITGGIISNGFEIHTAALHMHQLGDNGTISIKRADGAEDCLVNIPEWDFEWQQPYVLKEAVLVEPGDQVSLRCTWDNSQANQPYHNVDTDNDGTPDDYQQNEPRDVDWGDGTQDEMCLGVIYVTAP